MVQTQDVLGPLQFEVDLSGVAPYQLATMAALRCVTGLTAVFRPDENDEFLCIVCLGEFAPPGYVRQRVRDVVKEFAEASSSARSVEC